MGEKVVHVDGVLERMQNDMYVEMHVCCGNMLKYLSVLGQTQEIKDFLNKAGDNYIEIAKAGMNQNGGGAA